MPRFTFVRHGATVAGAGRCLGHADVDLSPPGVQQIHALAESWTASSVPPPTRIFSSDLKRARGSAAILAETFGLSVTIDARLRELHFGAWDGRLWDDIQRDDGERLRAWTDAWTIQAPPHGERVTSLLARAAAVIAERRGQADEHLLIISHAGWIRAALLYLLREPVERFFDHPADYAHAWIVDATSDDAAVVAENVAIVTAVAGSFVPPRATPPTRS